MASAHAPSASDASQRAAIASCSVRSSRTVAVSAASPANAGGAQGDDQRARDGGAEGDEAGEERARALGVGEPREPHAHDENDAGADDHERRRWLPGVDDVGRRAEPDVHENDDERRAVGARPKLDGERALLLGRGDACGVGGDAPASAATAAASA